MFRRGWLRVSEHERPFWLLVALAVMLLVTVSVTIVQAAGTTRLAHSLKRDLGALRVQLEQIDPRPHEIGREIPAVSADIGDGSAAFHRVAMATIIRGASRRLDRLIAGYREADEAEPLRRAESLSLVMFELQHQIDQLGRTADPVATEVARQAVDRSLGLAESALAELIDQQV